MVIMYTFVDLLSINDLITKVIAQVIVILSVVFNRLTAKMAVCPYL